jgi:hypothetical protein
LDGRGQRTRDVAARETGGRHFTLGADYRTVWYEIEW